MSTVSLSLASPQIEPKYFCKTMDVHNCFLKSECRIRFNEKLPEQVFLTLHGADSTWENEYLSKLLLSPNNIRQYKLFSKTETRPVFLEWIDEFHEVSKKSGINRQSICVVGSSPLEVLGVRDSTDLDFTISAEARKQFGSGITHLSQNVDIVTEQYHRSNHRQPISDDSLIGNEENHFYRYGLKFANIEIIEERKEFSARDKDLRDVELIKKWREETAAKEDSCNHALESLIEAELYIRELEAKLAVANHAIDQQSQQLLQLNSMVELARNLLRSIKESGNAPPQLAAMVEKTCLEMDLIKAHLTESAFRSTGL